MFVLELLLAFVVLIVFLIHLGTWDELGWFGRTMFWMIWPSLLLLITGGPHLVLIAWYVTILVLRIYYVPILAVALVFATYKIYVHYDDKKIEREAKKAADHREKQRRQLSTS